MAYLHAYLDVCAAYGWSGGPQGYTQIKQLLSGRERRNADWQDVQHKFTLPFQNISKEQYRSIKNMHLTCRQMLHCFRYRDNLDDTAEDELFATGDGTTKTFQLIKLSSADGVFYRRNIYALPTTPNDLVIRINGAVTGQFVVDRDRGLVEFTNAPANGALLTWSGTFDLWVRFNQDWLPFSIDSLNACNGSVELLEMPPPIDTSSAG